MLSREALEDLVAKYAEMLAMRGADEGQSRGDIRSRMAALARRFPGALREIDDLEIAEIRRRLAALNAVLQHGADPEPWMEALILFHSLARGALCAKRWLAPRRHVDAEVERAFAADSADLAFPEEARNWAGDLARIASPPRGRVTDVVFARIAQELGITEREARLRVFGVPRRERARR